MGQAESELEYADEESEHMSYYNAYVALPIEQLALKAPMDVPIVVLIPPIDTTFPCCHWGQRGCYPGGKLRVY